MAPLVIRQLKSELEREIHRHVLPGWLPAVKPMHKFRYWPRHKFQYYSDNQRTGTIGWDLVVNPNVEANKKNVFRARIAGQLAPPMTWCRNSTLTEHNLDPKEANARGLLREIIGVEAYYRYVRTGIISVRGASGMLYVIRGGHTDIETRRGDNLGVVHERLCVQFKDKHVPYTDSVIMRVLLVRGDEQALRAMSNVRLDTAALRQHRRDT
jgi:hypothetical protein